MDKEAKAIIFDIKENDAFGKEKLISLEAILENFDIAYAIQVIPLGLKGKSERDKIKKIAGSRKFTYPVVQYNDLFIFNVSELEYFLKRLSEDNKYGEIYNEELIKSEILNDNVIEEELSKPDQFYQNVIKNLQIKISAFEKSDCQPSFWDNLCMNASRLTYFWMKRDESNFTKGTYGIDALQLHFLSKTRKRIFVGKDSIDILDLVHLTKTSIKYCSISMITKINNSPYMKIKHDSIDEEFITADTQITASLVDAIKLISSKLHSNAIVVIIKRSK